MALSATSVTSTATTVTPAAVPSTTETVPASAIGTNGALLNVINASGGSITVTLVDPGVTPLGGSSTAAAQSVANSANRWFRLSPGHVNQSTGNANVNFSSNSSVTYLLIPC